MAIPESIEMQVITEGKVIRKERKGSKKNRKESGDEYDEGKVVSKERKGSKKTRKESGDEYDEVFKRRNVFYRSLHRLTRKNPAKETQGMFMCF